MDNKERRIRIAELRILNGELHELMRSCPHELEPKGNIYHGYGGDVQNAECSVCGRSFRWYCEKSPSKKCEYNLSDFCKHCGRGNDLPQ